MKVSDESEDNYERELLSLLERLVELASQIDGKLNGLSEPAPFLKPPEVARILRMKPDSVRALIRNGELSAINVSNVPERKSFRISQASLSAFCLVRKFCQRRRKGRR